MWIVCNSTTKGWAVFDGLGCEVYCAGENEATFMAALMNEHGLSGKFGPEVLDAFLNKHIHLLKPHPNMSRQQDP